MGVVAGEVEEEAMLLALVLSVQATTAAAAAPNPCTDQMSELCRISPLFCPSAYPSDLAPGNGNVPCWPERGAPTVSRDTRVLSRPSTTSPSRAVANPSVKAGAPEARSEDGWIREGVRRFARALGSR